MFLKEREVFFTNDAWRVVLDLNATLYTEVVLIIREDLNSTFEQRKEITSFGAKANLRFAGYL